MSPERMACGRCSSPVEDDDLRCPVCSQPCPSVRRADEPQARVDVLRCNGCGAAMAYDATAGSPQCGFCGSTLRLESPDDPLEQTETFLPFTVDRQQALDAFRSWLGSLGLFRPADLTTEARLQSIRPLWWAAWIFDAEADVSWTADSDHGARRADWAPHAGRTTMRFERAVVSASRGLTVRETDQLASSYDIATCRPAPDDEPDDAVMEHFDVQRSFARSHILDAITQMAGERLRESTVPGSRVRNLSTAMVLRRLVTRRAAFPAWVLAYRYRDRLYRTVLSGQDPACILGSAPWSLARIAVAAGLGLAVAAALLLLILVLAT